MRASRRGLPSRSGSLDKAVAACDWGSDNVANKGLASAPLETGNDIVRVIEYPTIQLSARPA
jgi:hypothetical protein